MKKMMIVGMGMFLAGMLSGAEGNILQNGEFETVADVAKASDRSLMAKIRNGWDFGDGPVVSMPKRWTPNVGKALIRIIDAEADKKEAVNVHSGRYSLLMEPKNAHLYNSTRILPGKYRLSAWVKGEGSLMFIQYNYNAMNRNIRGSSCDLSIKPTPEWQEYSKIVEFGKSTPETAYSFLVILGTKGKFYLDDISLIPVKEPEAKK